MRLLFDEHISPQVVATLKRKFPRVEALSIHDTGWRGMADPSLLEVLDIEKWILVTRDISTIPEYAKARLAVGQTHAGVIYAPSKKLLQTDVRGLIRRLIAFVEKYGEEDWTCREGCL